MNQVTVRCASCTLSKTFEATGIIPAEWKNDAGELVCPNCHIPMKPLGEGDTLPAAAAVTEATKQLREGQATSAPVETEETLRKRLAEIRHAEKEVRAALSTWNEAKKDAAEARKTYDGAVSTMLAVTDRLTRVPSADDELPLFTKAAETAAASAISDDDVARLAYRLGEAGVACTVETILGWTDEGRAQAVAWLDVGTVEALPDFLAPMAHETATEDEAGEDDAHDDDDDDAEPRAAV